MIRRAAQNPGDRQDFIQVVLAHKAQFNRDPTLKEFGLGVTQSMAEVRQKSFRCDLEQ